MEQKEFQHRILEYIKDYYVKNKKVPFLRQILKKEKLNRVQFYRTFPKGLTQACQLAGVPVPEDRIKKMKRAVEASKAKKSEVAVKGADEEALPPTRLMLTEEQTKRLLGLSHLEGRKDPLVIIDELLDYDSKARKYGLSLAKRKRLSEALEAALQNGWRINSQPSFVEALMKAHKMGFLSWSYETVKFFMEVFDWAEKKGWSPFEFAEYVTRHYNELICYIRYMKGEITFEEFKRRIEPYIQS
jgi:hypothetical protein